MEQQYDSATATKRSPQNQEVRHSTASPRVGQLGRPSQALTQEAGRVADGPAPPAVNPAPPAVNAAASQGPRVGSFPPTLFQLPDRSAQSIARPMSEPVPGSGLVPGSIAALQHRYDNGHNAPQSHVANAKQVAEQAQSTTEQSAEPDVPSVDRAFAQMPAADSAPPWDRTAVSRQEQADEDGSDRGFDSASRLWDEQRVDSPVSRRDVEAADNASQSASNTNSDQQVRETPAAVTSGHQAETPVLATVKRWLTNKGPSGSSGRASTNVMLAAVFLILIPCAFIFGRNGIMNSSHDGDQPDNASVSLDPKETNDINDLPATMGIPTEAIGQQPDVMAQQDVPGPAPATESPLTRQERVSVKPQEILGHQSVFQPATAPANGNPDASYVVPAGAIMSSSPGNETGLVDPSVSTAGHSSTLSSYAGPAEVSPSSHSGIRYSTTPNGIEDFLRRTIEQR
ncbi:hypothetical protein SV7mr_05990 [Stieleria bergensis]|uniref:Uncharacterized protein n=1 Tax=Stieleria bergensis TaxID=2528025 RepID=A0A517SPS4_9BACT|nr:hypothetical protein SV7mr_05990 [Planctomycetes bacterium SV_7m_r]